MNILVTNDDGIGAEGIQVLAQAAAPFGKVTVVAPLSQCSAMSHRITLGRALEVEECPFPVEGVTAFSVDGTPADCVKAALDVLMKEKPDVVLSGINNGYNIGFDILYSGTVGAAMEALMNGIPAIALSRNDVGTFETTQAYIGQILERLLQEAIATLPEKQRIVFNLKYFEEMKYEDMSALLGTSVGALKASYHLAVKKIEQFFNEID